MDVLEILCVTMHQNDFSKIKKMNINTNIVFANQCDYTSYEEIEFNGHTAKMISTQTKGVGVNRNLALMYASADICMFADDDVVYFDAMEEIVLSEFSAHPDADVIIFNLNTDDKQRTLEKSIKTKKCRKFSRMPWGCARVAVRLSSVKKANIWFTTLFGGGCVFPSGEDSIWLQDAKRKGLTFYVSKQTIGAVSYETSTWFTGYDEKYYYGKGAFYQAARTKLKYFWMFYFILRSYKYKSMKWKEKLKWMNYGAVGYRKRMSYEEFKKSEI